MQRTLKEEIAEWKDQLDDLERTVKEEIASQMEAMATNHAVHRHLMDKCLREGRGMIDPVGYKYDELLLLTLRKYPPFAQL